jgi:hypothetical protein
MTAQATVIDAAALREVRAKVFRRRESTLDQEATLYGLLYWERTLTHYSARMRDALESLPERAFAEQPRSAEDEVWSAGQIVRHTLETQVDIFFKAIRQIAGTDEGSTAADLASIPTGVQISQSETLSLLDAIDRDINALFRSLPLGVDLHRTHPMEPFGEVSIGGAFMIAAIHVEDHASQLRELACLDRA